MKYVIDFLDYLEVVKKQADNTIINYKIDICEFIEFINNNVIKISKDDVFSYLEYLNKKNISKNSISRKLSSLRNFYNYLEKMEIVNDNYFNLVKNPKKDKNLPKYVKDNDIDKMFSIPDIKTEFGQRNLLIIRMLYSTGIRVNELVNIKLSDIDINDRTIKIMGKGSKERVVVFGSNTKESLILFLNNGRHVLDKKREPYLILNKNGNKLSIRYVREIINDIIIKASIDIHVSPHMLRHTFATNMLNNGADLVSVKDLLGHESLNTTSIYTHVSDDMLKMVYSKAHPRAHNGSR